jgi:hypothetical protein
MSEESKTPDADYVHMGGGKGIVPGSGSTFNLPESMDDPNLSQEDRDMRLAIALQQQENAAAYDAHKAKHDANVKANIQRTTRSNTHTRLAAVRAKDHGMLSVPAAYTTEHAYVSGDYDTPIPPNMAGASPQEIADYNMAMALQKVEQVGAGTVQTMNKIITEEKESAEAMAHRTERSNYTLPKKH